MSDIATLFPVSQITAYQRHKIQLILGIPCLFSKRLFFLIVLNDKEHIFHGLEIVLQLRNHALH